MEALFKELDAFIQQNNYDGVLTVCDKILAVEKGDGDALQCRAMGLLHLGRWDEALVAIEVFESQAGGKTTMDFEKAYCYYSTKQYSVALEILKKLSEKSLRAQHLRAQVLMRTEAFDKCLETFAEIESQYEGGEQLGNEFYTNHLAAFIHAGRAAEAKAYISKHKRSFSDSFEFVYNAATAALASGELETAQTFLATAKKLCVDMLTEDGYAAEDIENEKAIILAQETVVMQLLLAARPGGSSNGNAGASVAQINATYHALLAQKPTDQTVVGSVTNNLVVLHRQHHAAVAGAGAPAADSEDSLADALKKLKSIASVDKFTTRQRAVAAWNRASTLLAMNKKAECRELLAQIKVDGFMAATAQSILEAALAFCEGDAARAEDVLAASVKSAGTDGGSKVVDVQLALAQVQLVRRDFGKCLATLKAIKPLENKAAMVATVASLFQVAKQPADAVKAVADYEAHLQGAKKSDELVAVLKASARYFAAHGMPREAAKQYEKVLALRKADGEALAGVVVALSQFDSKAALAYEDRLMAVVNATDGGKLLIRNVEEVDDLETAAALLVSTSAHPSISAAATAGAASSSSSSSSSSAAAATAASAATANAAAANAGAVRKLKLRPGEEGLDEAAVAAKRAKEKQEKKREKRRRYKAKHLKPPKNFDPNAKPDPERWLPLKERTSFKKRFQKKNRAALDKHSQGSTSTADASELDRSGKVDPAQAAAKSVANAKAALAANNAAAAAAAAKKKNNRRR